MTDTRALLKFNECINAFFNSRLIIVDRTIAEFLSTVVSTPELMQVVTECARTFNFKRELSNAVESDNLGTRFMLPHNKRHVVALVTGLLNEFDRKNMSIVDFVTGFYPADASHTSYMSFCENVLRPYAEAFRSLLIGEDPDENKAAVADERSASPINDKAKEDGDTIGGKFEITYKNIPVGLGSYVHWDRKIDGRIAQAIMSIPAVKSVSIGSGENAYKMRGSEFHDEIFCEDGKVIRKTNNAGGIEGGMTNGEDITVTAVMKPIPTLKKRLQSIDCMTQQPAEAHFERSDTCAAEACAVVAEARLACVLANEILLKFGGDSMEDYQIK